MGRLTIQPGPLWLCRAIDPPGHRLQLNAASAAAASPSSPTPAPSAAFRLWSPLDKAVLANAAAAAATAMADPLMSLVDTAFVAKLGLVQLAALGPNAALFNVIFFIAFMAMAVVTTDQMAQANARRDVEGVGRGFFTSLTLAVALGLLCWAFIALFPEQVLGFFQTNDEVGTPRRPLLASSAPNSPPMLPLPMQMMGAAKTYAVIRALACPASLVMVTCQAAFRALLDLR